MGAGEGLRLSGGATAAQGALCCHPSGKGIPWHRVVGERGKIPIREPTPLFRKSSSNLKA